MKRKFEYGDIVRTTNKMYHPNLDRKILGYFKGDYAVETFPSEGELWLPYDLFPYERSGSYIKSTQLYKPKHIKFNEQLAVLIAETSTKT